MGFLGSTVLRLAAVVAVLAAAGCADRPPVQDEDPAPTAASLAAPLGPYRTSTATVPRGLTEAFGGGTIYYPSGRPRGDTFGGVIIAPGRNGNQGGMAWYGPLLASRGFVVFAIDTLHLKDRPAARAHELEAAMTYLTVRSPVATLVDADRLAVMGHSFGGGAALETAADRPTLRAAIPLMPYDKGREFSNVRVPTLVVAAQNDKIAPVSRHARRFYRSIPASSGKGYLEIAGTTHSSPKKPNTTLAAYVIAWLKRYVDGDERYERFLCPGPIDDPSVALYRNPCS
ncbi:alpha/beta hydrolase family protein [Actinomadura rubteroloni]|uniref:alpha/beta hydrolase family protein n=1 Tax=Actinomadura rubteroloni TaxID=1926885 RepID=UPI000CD91828|nr:dienelactone hydrolase family protein [Actinomadura rubteroloni]